MNASPPARKPGRPSQPIARDALITLARRAFAQSGYEGTSMAQVAEAASIRKASLFHHFPTKEALYVAAVEEVVSDLGRLVHQARVAEGPFPERLDRLGRLIIAYLSGHPEAARLLVREVLDRGPYLRQGGAETVEAATELISAFLAAGMDDGAFTRRDPRQLALSIVGLHLFFYAAEDLSGRIVGADIGSPEGRDTRTTEVLGQVRALCGVPAPRRRLAGQGKPVPDQSRSSAPMSTRSPVGRASPSRSQAGAGGTPAGSPASTQGEPARRR